MPTLFKIPSMAQKVVSEFARRPGIDKERAVARVEPDQQTLGPAGNWKFNSLWTNRSTDAIYANPFRSELRKNPQLAASSEKHCLVNTYKLHPILAHTPSNMLKPSHNSIPLPNKDLQPQVHFLTFCRFAGTVQQFTIRPT
jgi:hypothetical protein